jgi:NitT/TauT family transport system ATP-binding protein
MSELTEKLSPDLSVRQSSGTAAVLRGVTYSYPDGTKTLDDFSCEVGRGEIIAIIGPSGCGKSTLLRVLTGLVQPQQGEAEVAAGPDGRPGNTTMVFQEDVLLPWLSVRDNVGLYAKFSGQRGRKVDDWVKSLLTMMRLDDRIDAFPGQLSGGMRRRVGVLQPLAASPTLLLLDEPFSSVDEPTRIAILGDLRSLLRELRTSAVLVTHDLAEAISVSDRILIVTKRPMHMARAFDVDLGETRDLFAIREDPAYLALYREAWEALRKEIQG